MTLFNHQKRAKYCIKLQDKPQVNQYTCEWCDKSYIRGDVYQKHIKTCKSKSSFYIGELEEQVKIQQEEIVRLRENIHRLEVYKELYEKKDEVVNEISRTFGS